MEEHDDKAGEVVETFDPILVRVVQPEIEKTVAADVASFRTITIAAADAAPIPLFSQDRKRHKGTILVHNPLGIAAPAIAPYCFLAQGAQVAANGDARGAAIVAGDHIDYEAAGAAWIVPAGVAVSVTVIEERNV